MEPETNVPGQGLAVLAEVLYLVNLLLLPGTHFIAAQGTDSDYVIRALSQGDAGRRGGGYMHRAICDARRFVRHPGGGRRI